MARIIGIVAADPNRAIGRGGTLPWHYSADLRFFKRTTTGHTILMGRATFESIGKPLPNRTNVILSASGYEAAGTTTVRNVDEVLEFARRAGEDATLFVIGGAKVYEALSAHIDEWLVTRIPEVVSDADTFLPASIFDGFSLADTQEIGDGLTVQRLLRS